MLFWLGSIFCTVAALLPLVSLRQGRFVRKAALWLLLGGVAELTSVALYAVLNAADFNLGELHITQALALAFHLDNLSGFFIIIIGTVSICTVIYSMSYIEHYGNTARARILTSFLAVFILTMILVVASANTFSFLFFWELMSLFSFFMVMFDREKEETQKAGFFYFAMTQLGTVFLFLGFLFLYRFTGSFNIEAAQDIPQWGKGLVFVALFIGFGTKAGVMPFHKWLPYAHSASPSNVSALMSGVMLKVAIYGLVRFMLDVCCPDLWWGVLLLIFGAVTALLGIIYAFKESDLKKLLAYCSIENIGIIISGLGLYIIFTVYGLPIQADLCLFGALFHSLNHALIKSSLFMTAGSVIQATNTRNMEKMGGLSRRMPVTSVIFLTGACAITALPPLNGFASEIMLFQAYLGASSLDNSLLATLLIAGLAALALTSALAAASFAKTFGIVFLARPRSEAARGAHEAPFSMLLAPGILAALCVILGVFSYQILDKARSGLPVPNMLPVGIILGLVSALALLIIKLLKAPVRKAKTWGCGITEQTPHMEYTASGFSEPVLTVLKPVFRTKKVFQQEFSDSYRSIIKSAGGKITTLKFFEERIYLPVARFFTRVGDFISALHNVDMDALILYSFVAIVVVIAGVSLWI